MKEYWKLVRNSRKKILILAKVLLLKWLRVGCSFFDSFSHYLFVVFVFRSLSVGLVIVLVVDAKRTEKASANPVRRLQHLEGRSGWTTSVSSGAWGVRGQHQSSRGCNAAQSSACHEGLEPGWERSFCMLYVRFLTLGKQISVCVVWAWEVSVCLWEGENVSGSVRLNRVAE